MPLRRGRRGGGGGADAGDGGTGGAAPGASLPPPPATGAGAPLAAAPRPPGCLGRAWGRFMGTEAGADGGRCAAGRGAAGGARGASGRLGPRGSRESAPARARGRVAAALRRGHCEQAAPVAAPQPPPAARGLPPRHPPNPAPAAPPAPPASWVPEQAAPWPSRLFFFFCNGLVARGAAKHLDQSDLWGTAARVSARMGLGGRAARGRRGQRAPARCFAGGGPRPAPPRPNTHCALQKPILPSGRARDRLCPLPAAHARNRGAVSAPGGSGGQPLVAAAVGTSTAGAVSGPRFARPCADPALRLNPPPSTSLQGVVWRSLWGVHGGLFVATGVLKVFHDAVM
jgi:hypothetical protein